MEETSGRPRNCSASTSTRCSISAPTSTRSARPNRSGRPFAQASTASRPTQTSRRERCDRRLPSTPPGRGRRSSGSCPATGRPSCCSPCSARCNRAGWGCSNRVFPNMNKLRTSWERTWCRSSRGLKTIFCLHTTRYSTSATAPTSSSSAGRTTRMGSAASADRVGARDGDDPRGTRRSPAAR